MVHQRKIRLLVGVHLGAAMVLFALESCMPRWICVACRLLLFLQSGLMGLWASLGSSPWKARLLLSVGGVTGLAVMFAGVPSGWYIAPWHLRWLSGILRLSQMFGITAGLGLVMRLAGFAVSPITRHAVPREGRSQLTLREVLIFVSVVAVAFGGPELIRPSISLLVPAARRILVWPVLFGLVLVGTFWATLRPGTPVLRLGMVFMLAYALAASQGRRAEQQIDLVIAAWLFGATCAASSLVVRAAGCRLVRSAVAAGQHVSGNRA